MVRYLSVLDILIVDSTLKNEFNRTLSTMFFPRENVWCSFDRLHWIDAYKNYPTCRPKGRLGYATPGQVKTIFIVCCKRLWDWLIDYYLWVPLLYQTNISKSYCSWNSLNYLNDIRRIGRVSLIPKLLKGRLCVGNTTIQGMILLETRLSEIVQSRYSSYGQTER